jgi:hypothetical protein
MEKVRYPSLSVGSSEASRNHSFCQRLRCSRVALCLWLGSNGVAFILVKRAQHSNKKCISANLKDLLVFKSMQMYLGRYITTKKRY